MNILIFISLINSFIKKINPKYDLIKDFKETYEELIQLQYLLENDYKKTIIDQIRKSINSKPRLLRGIS